MRPMTIAAATEEDHLAGAALRPENDPRDSISEIVDSGELLQHACFSGQQVVGRRAPGGLRISNRASSRANLDDEALAAPFASQVRHETGPRPSRVDNCTNVRELRLILTPKPHCLEEDAARGFTARRRQHLGPPRQACRGSVDLQRLSPGQGAVRDDPGRPQSGEDAVGRPCSAARMSCQTPEHGRDGLDRIPQRSVCPDLDVGEPVFELGPIAMDLCPDLVLG